MPLFSPNISSWYSMYPEPRGLRTSKEVIPGPLDGGPWQTRTGIRCKKVIASTLIMLNRTYQATRHPTQNASLPSYGQPGVVHAAGGHGCPLPSSRWGNMALAVCPSRSLTRYCLQEGTGVSRIVRQRNAGRDPKVQAHYHWSVSSVFVCRGLVHPMRVSRWTAPASSPLCIFLLSSSFLGHSLLVALSDLLFFPFFRPVRAVCGSVFASLEDRFPLPYPSTIVKVHLSHNIKYT